MTSVRLAKYEDMALAADIMVTSFRTAFADFVSRSTMDACTNLDNCRASSPKGRAKKDLYQHHFPIYQ